MKHGYIIREYILGYFEESFVFSDFCGEVIWKFESEVRGNYLLYGSMRQIFEQVLIFTGLE
ncbi:hypothetical protein PsorP6_007404 [Peronosclerospora sorghi]|uniref:Uncharacterized protein n=1 Tax=Peronosclerospora sorghi TaxID=230839 RepID=A0ACC0WBW4_9STRA|nr:hypothetical protein PsorP6_007404 [Peronosclerospora sorghi]